VGTPFEVQLGIDPQTCVDNHCSAQSSVPFLSVAEQSDAVLLCLVGTWISCQRSEPGVPEASVLC
jgi:hypothetical protein